jgi:hypothetical protein
VGGEGELGDVSLHIKTVKGYICMHTHTSPFFSCPYCSAEAASLDHQIMIEGAMAAVLFSTIVQGGATALFLKWLTMRVSPDEPFDPMNIMLPQDAARLVSGGSLACMHECVHARAHLAVLVCLFLLEFPQIHPLNPVAYMSSHVCGPVWHMYMPAA